MAVNIIPSPISILSCKVSIPRNSRVVCKKAVRQMAITCLHHWLKPSVYPRGTLNIYSDPTAIWISRIPPRLILAKKP